MWLSYLWSFLRGFIPAMIKAFAKRTKEISAWQDRGAQAQRDADDEADNAIADDARKNADEISKLPDSDFARRMGRWKRKP